MFDALPRLSRVTRGGRPRQENTDGLEIRSKSNVTLGSLVFMAYRAQSHIRTRPVILIEMVKHTTRVSPFSLRICKQKINK